MLQIRKAKDLSAPLRIAQCTLMKFNWSFGETDGIHLHCQQVSQIRNKQHVCLLFDPESGGDMFTRNVGWLLSGNTIFIPEGGNIRSYRCGNL
jgi:hypothetical protein